MFASRVYPTEDLTPGFLSFSAIDSWLNYSLLQVTGLCTVGSLAASPASTHQRPVDPLPSHHN